MSVTRVANDLPRAPNGSTFSRKRRESHSHFCRIAERRLPAAMLCRLGSWDFEIPTNLHYKKIVDLGVPWH
jgi:hypothetical protein